MNPGRVNAFERLARHAEAFPRLEPLPDETSAYVPKIAAAAIIANNLQHFGFDEVKYAKAEETGEIAVPAGTSLKTIAKAAGIPLSTVKNLNPDFLAERVPPGRGGDWLVQLPPETLSKTQVTLPCSWLPELQPACRKNRPDQGNALAGIRRAKGYGPG